MNDFIFGTLATDELRRERVYGFRSGVTHNHHRDPIDPAPAQPIIIHATSGPASPGDRAWVYWTTDGTDPEGADGLATRGYATPLEVVKTEWDTVLWGYIRHFRAVLPGQPAKTLLRYRISCADAEQGEVFADHNTYYACWIDDDPAPEWAKNAVVYEIFVDRFNPGNGKQWLKPDSPSGFFGGTIRGITEKLDYLINLGVNTLWLTPIFPSPSHHGYDATDLFEIEPRLGTKADLQELINLAHLNGIRIILDLVPNHFSNLHKSFQDAISRPDSPYRDWYTFKHWPDQYESFFGVKEMPQINLRKQAARDYLLSAVKYWLEMGVDGYRVDYAIGPSADFWAEFRRVTRSVRPDCWTFGEIVDPSDVQLTFAGGLDGALDFILLEGLRQSIAFGNWSAFKLSRFISRHDEFFPDTFSRPSFLDNHDMNRFLWAAGNDKRRLKMAALCQFGLIGAPVIYYGTEIGLSQERDVRQDGRGLPEESRLPMPWEQPDNSLFNWYRELIALRKNHPKLVEGKLIQHTDTAFVYLAERATSTHSYWTFLNLSGEDQKVKAPQGTILISTTEQKLHQDQNGWINLPAYSGGILKT